MMFYMQNWQACGYHIPLLSVDTGHLPNLLFIKDAIIKHSATSIVLSEDRSIWSIYLPMFWLNWLQPIARYIEKNQPTLIWVSSIINSSLFFLLLDTFWLVFLNPYISRWRHGLYYEQTFVTLLQYFYKIDQESKDIIHKQYLLVWFFAFDVPIYVIYGL